MRLSHIVSRINQPAIQDYFRSAQVIKQQGSVNMENKSVKSDSRSSISSKRLEAEEKRIELEARKQAMKRKREIEMAKTALKMEEEELDIVGFNSMYSVFCNVPFRFNCSVSNSTFTGVMLISPACSKWS
jgi:hypothetical protein